MAEPTNLLESFRTYEGAAATPGAGPTPGKATLTGPTPGKATIDHSVGDYAGSFGAGVNRGLAMSTVDAANWLLGNLVKAAVPGYTKGMEEFRDRMGQGLSSRPIGGVKQLTDMAPEMMTGGADDTATGRVLGGVGEVVGMSVLPTGTMQRAARGAGATAKYLAPSPTGPRPFFSQGTKAWDNFMAPRPTDGVLRRWSKGLVKTAATRPEGVKARFIEGMANSPGKAAVGELAAATGAGVGHGLAQEYAPGDTAMDAWSQLIGGIVPAAVSTLAPSAMLARAGTKVAGWVRREGNPEHQAQVAREKVNTALGEELTPENEARIAEGYRLSQEMPGFEPSVGEATGSGPLLRTQEDMQARAQGPRLEQLRQRRTDSEQAIDTYSENQLPAPEVRGPSFVVQSAEKRVIDLRERAAEDVRGGTVEQMALVESRVPKMEGSEKWSAGETLRERIADRRRAVRDDLRKARAEAGLDTTDVTVAFSKVRKALLDDNPNPRDVAFGDVAGEPAILAEIRDMPVMERDPTTGRFSQDRVSFEGLMNLRERIGDDLADVAASPGRGQRKQIRTLTKMKVAFDRMLDDLASTTDDPQLASRYKQYRDRYYNELIVPFEKGVAQKINKRNGQGFYVMPEEKIAEAFFQPKNVTAARDYRAIFGNDPAAMRNIQAVALDSLSGAAVRDGVLDPTRMVAWLNKYKDVLGEFPEVVATMTNVKHANDAVFARQAQLLDRQAWLEKQMMVRAINSYSGGSKTPEAIISEAIADPRKMDELRVLLQADEAGSVALRKEVWKRTAGGTSDDVIKALTDNAESLKVLFGQQHMRALQDIAAARSMLEMTAAPHGKAASSSPFAAIEKLMGGRSMGALASRGFAFKSGRMSKGYLAVDTVSSMMRGRAQVASDDLLFTALWDPEFAKQVHIAVKLGKVTPYQARRINSRLFAIGLQYLPEEED